MNKFLLTVFTFFVLLSNSYADRATALEAHLNGNYEYAARLWSNLANEGDPIAQYNLSLLYESGNGVNADQNIARYWKSMAARKGVADAYVQLNTKNLQPGSTTIKIKSISGPQDWVSSQNPKYYTLQLASSTNEKLISKYYNENSLEGKAGYYKSRREGEEWYALVYGAYPSVSDAKAAIDKLPADLKKWSPWVRNIKSIHKIMID